MDPAVFVYIRVSQAEGASGLATQSHLIVRVAHDSSAAVVHLLAALDGRSPGLGVVRGGRCRLDGR